jgi:hypothetical protein
LRIKENFYEGCEFYSDELQQQVAQAFTRVSRITEMKKLLTEIKGESSRLREIFLTDEERKEKNDVDAAFEFKMVSMMLYTFGNMERYQLYGWKELFDDGDDGDDTKTTV